MTEVTMAPSDEDYVDPENTTPGTLLLDHNNRLFMTINKPGFSKGEQLLVRLSKPCGFYKAEALKPFTRYKGSVTLTND